jgi:hypothetical protein
MTAALFLALASSLAYGAADFLGGVAARGAHVLRVVVIAAPASLLVEVLLWPLVGAHFDTGAIVWGAASGVASAAAFAGELGEFASRVGGVVARLQEILNVDGYQVLRFDRQHQQVHLDLEKLAQQFDIQL